MPASVHHLHLLLLLLVQLLLLLLAVVLLLVRGELRVEARLRLLVLHLLRGHILTFLRTAGLK